MQTQTHSHACHDLSEGMALQRLLKGCVCPQCRRKTVPVHALISVKEVSGQTSRTGPRPPAPLQITQGLLS